MTDFLKDDLAGLAEHVKTTDVTERAHATARRLKWQRGVVAGVVALAIATGGVAGASTLAGATGGDSAPPAGSNVEPTPDGVKGLTGTIIEAGLDDEDVELFSRPADGSFKEQGLTLLTEVNFATVRVSPDGRYVSWVSGTEADQVRVRELATGDDLPQVGDVSVQSMYGACMSPQWSPDGRHLFIDRGIEYSADRFGLIDIATNHFTPIPGYHGCDPQVATGADGQDVVYSVDEGLDADQDIFASDTTGRSTVTQVGEALKSDGAFIEKLTAVSPDGRYACLVSPDASGQNGPESNDCHRIVEIKTGRSLDLSVHGEWSATTTVFAKPGELLLKIADTVNESGGARALIITSTFDGHLTGRSDWQADTRRPRSMFMAYIP